MYRCLVGSVEQSGIPPAPKNRLVNAHRDALVLVVLITAVVLLIWNGSTFFERIRFVSDIGPDLRIASTALTLNVALILFGWRRYVDLQHEAEMRAEQEKRAAVLATTDSVTGLLNRKGFADIAGELCKIAAAKDKSVGIISFQINRFKSINDQHGYETGDRLLKCIANGLNEALGSGAVIARLSGDEFAVAIELDPAHPLPAEEAAELILHATTRPFMFEDRIIQVVRRSISE